MLARAPWQVWWLALALIWGSSFLLMKLGLLALHPVQLSTLRVIVAALTLLILARITRAALPRELRTWVWLSVTACFLCTVPFTLFALAETRISSALAGIGNAITPIASVLMALLLLPSDRPTPRKLIAVAIGFIGVVIIGEPWSEHGPDLLGFGLALIAGTSYGIGWAINRRALGHVDLGGLSQPTALMIAAVPQVIVALLVWSTAEGWQPLELAGSPGDWWLALPAILALGAVGTGLAYVMQYEVVRRVGPTTASTTTYLIPVVSVALGALVLHERLGVFEIVGAVIVIGAGYLVQRPARAPRAPERDVTAE